MAANDRQDMSYAALRVARLYYQQQLTTAAIAQELGTSRATVSRLLSFASETGLVEVRIHDPAAQPQQLESRIQQEFGLKAIQVVPVPPGASEQQCLQRVAQQAAAYLNTIVEPQSVLGVAWGTTLAAVADALIQKPVRELDVVQLNGSATGANFANAFGESIVSRLAQNFGARSHSFPVPAFFDYAATREALWRERSIQALRALQERARVLVFSIGAARTGSHVHSGDYLDEAEFQSLQADGVVGDIATVFFRADGSWRDIALNARSSGLELDRFQRAEHALCVVSGRGELAGLRAALRGGFINELVLDEPTAMLLLEEPESR